MPDQILFLGYVGDIGNQTWNGYMTISTDAFSEELSPKVEGAARDLLRAAQDVPPELSWFHLARYRLR